MTTWWEQAGFWYALAAVGAAVFLAIVALAAIIVLTRGTTRKES